ncbi:MAG: substrate-binding domain-containing protein [Actinobacteria bacterium]|nr:substrate-binding domain-containing protein [Actinomycetota bacterium]
MKNLPIFTSVIFLAISFMLFVPSCKKSVDTEVILATTTSTLDSGLLDELLPAFEKETGYVVKPIGVGTGEAIEMGRRGEADVILVHSRPDEDKFVEEGYGVNRRDVMHNDFIIVGPEDDPAGIKGLSCEEAFKILAEGKAPFVSRGDNSGTHKKELAIWNKVGVEPQGDWSKGDWYIETGQGMGETLRVADEKKAYTLTDRGTYLSTRDSLELVILVEGDEILFNPYGVIAVNPEKHPGLDINYDGAMAFIEFITGPKGQEIIKNFGVEEFGQPLFYPDVIK